MNDAGLQVKHSSSLLAVMISILSLLIGLLLIGLFVTGFAAERRFADLPDREKDQFVNHRLQVGLKTFETAILPRTSANSAVTSTINVSALFSGVPYCRDAWADEPSVFKQKINAWRGKSTDFRSTAVRMVERLIALDAYLAMQSTVGDRRLEKPVGLDLSRWIESVNYALTQPIHVPSMGRLEALSFSCGDVAVAVSTLMPESCRQAMLLDATHTTTMRLRRACTTLETLHWRDTSVGQAKRQFLPEQQIAIPNTLLVQHNPWQGVRGCVYLKTPGVMGGKRVYWSDARQSNRDVCETPEVAGVDVNKRPSMVAPLTAVSEPSPDLSDGSWALPPSLGMILRPLEALRQPGSTLYQRYTESPQPNGAQVERYGFGRNQADIRGNRLDVGFSVDLTLNPVTQAYAQQVAACYTGNQAVCRALGVVRQEDRDGQGRPLTVGHTLLESAVVRMAGVAIIDIPTGRIEALAGQLSPCTRQDYNGPSRDASCDNRLPWKPRFRPDLLENPSLFHEAMPASTIKPLMAAAILTDGTTGRSLLANELTAMRQPGQPLGGLRQELMTSNSRAFLDRMFCREKGFNNCERPQRIQDLAEQFGWNTACANQAECGQRDVLFGRAATHNGLDDPVQPLAQMRLYGRLLSELAVAPAGEISSRYRRMDWTKPELNNVSGCANGIDGQPFSKDDWAQCRMGSIGPWVHEGWGQGNARASALGVAGMMSVLGASANGLQALPVPHLVESVRGVGQEPLERILQTADKRFELTEPIAVPIAKPVADVILGGLSWSHRGGTASLACTQLWDAKTCRGIDWIAGKTGTPTFQHDGKSLMQIQQAAMEGGEMTLRPYKWYTAVVRLPGSDSSWQKAIGVLTERNWQKGNSMVHGVGDIGPNPAAEIALWVAKCMRDNPNGQKNGPCR